MSEPNRFMSDYELIELFDIYLASAMDYFMNFVAVLFAFIVAAYFVGDRMSKTMLILFIALYTIFSGAEFVAVYVSTLWWAEIANEIMFRGVDVTGRMNYPLAMFSEVSGDILRYVTYTLYFASYLGGLVFLREVRLLESRK